MLWGETHGHTAFAEGQGSPSAFFTYATEDARLDFATLSEHDIWLDDAEWRELQRLTRESSAPGEFVGILGYEWTAFPNRGGHHNVFFRDPRKRARRRADRATASRISTAVSTSATGPSRCWSFPTPTWPATGTQSDAELERLVELYSVHGSFEWYANKYLQNGFQVGFVAAADDHLAKPGLAPPPLSSVSQPGGLAAVFAPAATTDAVFDALRNLRSYATSGQRILLGATLNGHDMGTRQAARAIAARSRRRSPAPRPSIASTSCATARSSTRAAISPRSSSSRSALQVAFESSSEVFGAVDNPRGYRVWRGTLEVEGARLTGVRRTGLDNPLRDRFEWDPAKPQTVRFSILTRGRADSILLDLDGAGAQTRLHFQLEATKETGAASTRRPLHDVPAADFTLTLDGLEKGRLEHEMPPVGEHVDRVSLQVVNPDAPLDQKLQYTDLDAKGDGDYYYVRVTQLDGARAWSSPFWVGGKSGRGRPTRPLSSLFRRERRGRHRSLRKLRPLLPPLAHGTRRAAAASARPRATTRTRCRWRSRRAATRRRRRRQHRDSTRSLFATTSPPYAEKSNAATLHAALSTARDDRVARDRRYVARGALRAAARPRPRRRGPPRAGGRIATS